MEAAAAESRRAGGGCGAGGGALCGRAANQPGPTFLTGHPARESPSSAQELARGRTRRPPPVGPALHPRVASSPVISLLLLSSSAVTSG